MSSFIILFITSCCFCICIFTLSMSCICFSYSATIVGSIGGLPIFAISLFLSSRSSLIRLIARIRFKLARLSFLLPRLSFFIPKASTCLSFDTSERTKSRIKSRMIQNTDMWISINIITIFENNFGVWVVRKVSTQASKAYFEWRSELTDLCPKVLIVVIRDPLYFVFVLFVYVRTHFSNGSTGILVV